MELNINISISDIISEISKKDKKRQVFILTSLIKDLKNTRIEAKSNYEDCNASYTRRTDNFLGHFNLMIWNMCYSTKDKPYFKLRHNGK